MPHYKIVLNQEFQKPIDEVFDALADHNRLGQIFGVPVKRIKDGTDTPNGVGSIRRIGPWPIGTQETVTALKPNEKIDYRISRFGGPMRKHRGNLSFEGDEKGCRLVWTIEFDALPGLGGLVKQTLAKGLGRGLKRFAG